MGLSAARRAAAVSRPTPDSRACARDLLDAVLRRRRPLDEALNDSPDLARLEARDRAFVRLLVATTLRRLGQIDDAIEAFLDKRARLRQSAVRSALRLGAAQALFLATPAHAAVDTTVDLVPADARGLVNALMRRLVRDGAAHIARQDAARINTPDWLWQSWAETYGAETARAIAEAHLEEPPLDLALAHDDAERWAERLGGAAMGRRCVRLHRAGPIERLDGFGDGLWWVQDLAAQLPVRALGDVRGQLVADLCAAPGGKTLQLAHAGAEVEAIDRSPGRLRRLRANVERMGGAVNVHRADALGWRPTRPIDKVLLDAPCTGSGTIRRHPDIARLKKPADLAALGAVQERLIAAALALLRPGGVLVYCVCSLEPEEGIARIEAVLAQGAPARRAPIGAAEMGDAEVLTPLGDLRTLPSHQRETGGMDGFYAARLVRL